MDASQDFLSFSVAMALTLVLGAVFDRYLLNAHGLDAKELLPRKLEPAKEKKLTQSVNEFFFVQNGEKFRNKDLGGLERLLFFLCFLVDAHLIIGAWLAFKLASKWQVWEQVVKLPADLGLGDKPLEFGIRARYGTNLLRRWLVGTLGNVLLGVVGYGVFQLLIRTF